MKWIRRNAKIIKSKAAEYFIPREELVQRLSRSDKKLTILCAPSGYGKTALMGLCAGSSEAPSAWYRLDGDDNVDTAFLETLTASLETAVPEFSWSPEEVRRRQGPETFWEEDDFYQRLGRELAYSLTKALNGRKLMLMLDDFQTLGARPVLLILSGLIGELPQGMRIFISTRGRIPEFTLRFLTAGKPWSFPAEIWLFQQRKQPVFSMVWRRTGRKRAWQPGSAVSWKAGRQGHSCFTDI